MDVKLIPHITEHRAYSGTCSCCNKIIENSMPINDIITYGDNLKSLTAMLSSEGLVSINRIKQMLSELTGCIISLSEDTIAKWNKDLSSRLTPAINSTKEKLLVSPVLHKDETGIRVGNNINWLHVLSNKAYTLYFSDKKRGNSADKDIDLLPAYSGVLMRDHLIGLYSFNCRHAKCNAHILRYLKSAAENEKCVWASEMIKLLLSDKVLVETAKQNRNTALAESEISEYFRKYNEILEKHRWNSLKARGKITMAKI